MRMSTRASIVAAAAAVLAASPSTGLAAVRAEVPAGDAAQPVGSNRLVSINADGTTTGNLGSANSGVSHDGRYVTFMSQREHLVAGERHRGQQIYLRDQTTGVTTLVSRSPTGAHGRAPSDDPSISADGTRVAYTSKAANLVPGTERGAIQVYLYDATTQTTDLVSHDGAGTQGDDMSSEATISADGSHVAFTSEAELVPRDGNESADVFVWAAATDTVSMVSVRPNGRSGLGVSGSPAITADGSLVAFGSAAADLLRGDKNKHTDVFLRDVDAGTTRIVSETSDLTGNGGKGDSWYPTMSADGGLVAFGSEAFNLVPGSTRWYNQQILVRDMTAGDVRLVSHAPDGAIAGHRCDDPSISADGRQIAFASLASNLVPGDDNFLTDIYVYDAVTDSNTLISTSPSGDPGDGSSNRPAISGNGAYVAYSSDADNLDARDDDGYDVFSYRAS